jgi:hypothetical protein
VHQKARIRRQIVQIEIIEHIMHHAPRAFVCIHTPGHVGIIIQAGHRRNDREALTTQWRRSQHAHPGGVRVRLPLEGDVQEGEGVVDVPVLGARGSVGDPCARAELQRLGPEARNLDV